MCFCQSANTKQLNLIVGFLKCELRNAVKNTKVTFLSFGGLNILSEFAFISWFFQDKYPREVISKEDQVTKPQCKSAPYKESAVKDKMGAL